MVEAGDGGEGVSDDLNKAARPRAGEVVGVTVAVVEMEKIRDALIQASAFFQHRDDMNAVVHLAKQTRMSPLTSIVEAARERIESIIGTSPRTDIGQ